jgi:hypothetical protein
MLLAACGGGGGGGSPAGGGAGGGIIGGGSAGIDRTGAAIAVGPVTGFGSVFVNGVRYDTSSATFTIDDNPGGQDDLAVGDVVVVRGTISDDLSTGTATSVAFEDAVEGPLEQVNELGSSLVVMGQTVLVTADTSFDDSLPGSTLADLVGQEGIVVEVSGLAQATGEISATRIELKAPGGVFEVKGRVANVNTVAMSFVLGNLVIDYSSAQLRDLPAGGLTEGLLVEVKGASANYTAPVGATPPMLVASEVEGRSAGFGGNLGDRLEIEGFITRFVSATDFDVFGQPVTTSASTVYTGGAGVSAADLGLNVKVEVEGLLNGSGVLVASKVDIRRAKAVRVFAQIDSVDALNSRFVLLGIEVRVDSLTRLEDKTNAKVDPLGLADLNVGDYLEVRGSEDPSSSADMVAAIVERDDADDTILQGFVTSVADPSFEILGVTIDTTTTSVFRDVDDSIMSRQAFFAELAPGRLVKAKGSESSSTVLAASEVEYEIEF